MCNRKKWQFCMPFSNHGCLKKTLPSSYITIPPHSNYSCLISSFWCYIIMHRHKKIVTFLCTICQKTTKTKTFPSLFVSLPILSYMPPCLIAKLWARKTIMGIVENILKSTKILNIVIENYLWSELLWIYSKLTNQWKKMINRKKNWLIFWF